jgi:tRNA (pseudouridine54-N1)-methyltransferase
MKEFILRARKAKTNASLDIDNLPKEGKMDSVCATISNAIWISGDVRKDTVIHAVLEGPNNAPRTVSFYGNEIRSLRSDERSIAGYIKFALAKTPFLQPNEEAHVRPGIRIARKSFERLVYEKSRQYRQIILLEKDGKDVRGFAFEKDFAVIFGSPEGLAPKTEKFMESLKASRISLGPKMLFAAHCPIIIHNEIDRKQN